MSIQHHWRHHSNLISKDANLVFYLSGYQVDLLFKLANMTRYDRILYRYSIIGDVIQKVQRHHDMIKALP